MRFLHQNLNTCHLVFLHNLKHLHRIISIHHCFSVVFLLEWIERLILSLLHFLFQNGIPLHILHTHLVVLRVELEQAEHMLLDSDHLHFKVGLGLTDALFVCVLLPSFQKLTSCRKLLTHHLLPKFKRNCREAFVDLKHLVDGDHAS